MTSQQRVWDLFVRIYHLCQLVLICLLWYSGEQGDFESHFAYGYMLLALVVTRIVWGVIGSQTARFSYFVASPAVTWRYVKSLRHVKPHFGHNPVAGYMVLALLTSLAVQLGTGLFVTDDVLAEGPLYMAVSESFAEQMKSIHHANFDVLLSLIALHVIGAVYHVAKGDNVIATIMSGRTELPPKRPIFWRTSTIAFVLWALIGTTIFYFWYPTY